MQLAGLLSTISLAVIAIFVLVGVVIYSIRLQRRAVVTQKAVVEDHFSEKAQRQRQYVLMEQSLELQREAAVGARESLELFRQAVTRDEETRALLRRSVEVNEEILAALRGPRT